MILIYRWRRCLVTLLLMVMSTSLTAASFTAVPSDTHDFADFDGVVPRWAPSAKTATR